VCVPCPLILPCLFSSSSLFFFLESTTVSIDEILLSYERFLERVLYSVKISSDSGMVKLILQLHSSFQIALFSHIHSKDFIQYLLSTTGLLHLFDLIITSEDLIPSPSSSPSSSVLPLPSIYSQVISRLKSHPSLCLFVEHRSEEQKSLNKNNNFQFYEPASSSELVLSEAQHDRRRRTSFLKRKVWWSKRVLWIGVPFVLCLIWSLLRVVALRSVVS
jgi:hypothetical protein